MCQTILKPYRDRSLSITLVFRVSFYMDLTPPGAINSCASPLPPCFANSSPSFTRTPSRVISSSLLLGLLSSLDLGKSPDSLPDALDEQRHRDHDPDKVAEEVVPPEVEALGAAVDDLEDALAEEAGAVVEEVAVDLAQADDELQRESDRVVLDDGPGQEEREGAPGERSDALHAYQERVLGEVAGVGEGVLLPELGEEVVLGSELGKVDSKVACKG